MTGGPDLVIDAASADRQFLEFTLDGASYALGVAGVRAIAASPKITRIPHAPPFVPGVANLRGAIVPLVDARARLGLPGRSTRGARVVVFVAHGGGARTVGLVLDDMPDLVELGAADIGPAPARHPGAGRGPSLGRAAISGRTITILDPERLLDPPAPEDDP